MSRAQKSKPDRSGFCTLRWLFAELGKKEVCGISRWTVQLRVGCLKQLSTPVLVWMIVVRKSLLTLFPDKWNVDP